MTARPSGGGGGIPDDGSVTNAKVAANAAIAKSKLASLAITDADIAGGASIARSKLNLTASIGQGDLTFAVPGISRPARGERVRALREWSTDFSDSTIDASMFDITGATYFTDTGSVSAIRNTNAGVMGIYLKNAFLRDVEMKMRFRHVNSPATGVVALRPRYMDDTHLLEWNRGFGTTQVDTIQCIGAGGGFSGTEPIPIQNTAERIMKIRVLGDIVFVKHWMEVAASTVKTVTIGGTPTGGTFTLTYGGQTTTGLAFNAAASAVQTALQALSSVGAANLTVSGSAGGPYTLTWAGDLANTYTTALTGSAAGLTGGSPTLTIATTTFGATGLEPDWQRLGRLQGGAPGSNADIIDVGRPGIYLNPITNNTDWAIHELHVTELQRDSADNLYWNADGEWLVTGTGGSQADGDPVCWVRNAALTTGNTMTFVAATDPWGDTRNVWQIVQTVPNGAGSVLWSQWIYNRLNRGLANAIQFAGAKRPHPASDVPAVIEWSVWSKGTNITVNGTTGNGRGAAVINYYYNRAGAVLNLNDPYYVFNLGVDGHGTGTWDWTLTTWRMPLNRAQEIHRLLPVIGLHDPLALGTLQFCGLRVKAIA